MVNPRRSAQIVPLQTGVPVAPVQRPFVLPGQIRYQVTQTQLYEDMWNLIRPYDYDQSTYVALDVLLDACALVLHEAYPFARNAESLVRKTNRWLPQIGEVYRMKMARCKEKARMEQLAQLARELANMRVADTSRSRSPSGLPAEIPSAEVGRYADHLETQLDMVERALWPTN